MSPVNRRRLVIDANVFVSAGSDPLDAPARPCRAFLDGVLGICHRAVVTAEIIREWDDHPTKYSAWWQTQMASQDKLVPPAEGPPATLRDQVRRSATDDAHAEHLLKDVLLLEAAFGADMIVVSCDDEAKRRYARLAAESPHLGHLLDVAWVNTNSFDGVEEWLASGAKRSKRLTLRSLEP